jgi:hypothetical protein
MGLESMRYLLIGLACAASLTAPTLAHGQDEVRVTTLARDDHILVSLVLPGAYSDEIRDAVASGLETSFTFDIELRRAVPFWFDRTVDQATVSASVQYDGLTDRYRVERTVDGRAEQAQVVEEEAAVRQLLTTLERLPLFETGALETNGDYGVRVRVDTRPRLSWFRWPWDRSGVLGRASFTFVP